MKRYIIFLLFSTSALAQTPTTVADRKENWWDSAEYTNPYLYYGDVLSATRVTPLRSSSQEPDVLQLFMRSSSARRFVVAQVVATDQRATVTFIEPADRRHPTAKIRRVRRNLVQKDFHPPISRFIVLQAEGDPANPANSEKVEVVCIDGPDWLFALRVSGTITTGRVHTCNNLRLVAFGCSLVRGRACRTDVYDGLNLWTR